MTWRKNCLAFSHRHLKKNERQSLLAFSGRCSPSRTPQQTQASHETWETWALVGAQKTLCGAVLVSLAPGESYQLSLKVWLFLSGFQSRLYQGMRGFRRGKGVADIIMGTCFPLPFTLCVVEDLWDCQEHACTIIRKLQALGAESRSPLWSRLCADELGHSSSSYQCPDLNGYQHLRQQNVAKEAMGKMADLPMHDLESYEI